jgi:hypothetical protein
MKSWLFLLVRFTPLLCLPLLLSSCVAVGALAYKLQPPKTIKPEYTNLAGQSIGVMIWLDRGIRIDWPGLQLDIANSVDKQLRDQALDAKGKNQAKVLLGATFPVLPASIIRYQMDHPELEAYPITDVAPKFGVSRLIYVEVEDFATRSDRSVELYRGSAKATVRVIEIDKDGKAKIAFERPNITASYPPKAPPEGAPNLGDQKTYTGLVDAFSTEIAHLFFPYQVEPD